MVVNTLHQIVDDFPPVQHAFGYGSGVFHQPDLYEQPHAATGNAPAVRSDGPQLDFIFGVEDPLQWHAEVGFAPFPRRNALPLLGSFLPSSFGVAHGDVPLLRSLSSWF